MEDSLTGREKEILILVADGKTNKEIGYKLNISELTVCSHMQNINNKLRTSNRTDAVMTAIRQSLITIKAG
jgi:DNA-binding NarL/FixJ family response regulator